MDCVHVVAAPSLYRRHLLGLAALAPWISGCGIGDSVLGWKLRSLPMEPISSVELELLRDKSSRKAWQAKQGLPEVAPLEIRNRIVGKQHSLLRDADIENVCFVNCRFEMFQGYGNDLDNVVFEDCQFLGGVFSGEIWKSVRLFGCEAVGVFQIGAVDGDIVFEQCVLQGRSVTEGGYGNWSDNFGLAGSENGVSVYRKCRIGNVCVVGNKSLSLLECKVGDLNSDLQTKGGDLIIDAVVSDRRSRQNFGGQESQFNRVQISNSKMGLVDLSSIVAKELKVIDSELAIEMNGMKSKFDNVVFKKSVFFGKGVYSPAVKKVGSFLLEDCKFEHGSQSLVFCGVINKRPRAGEDSVNWLRVERVLLRNQKLNSPEMAFLKVGALTLENSHLENANLAYGHFGTIEFIDSKLTGTLDLTDTTIQHIDNRGLVNNAKVLGKLEADPQAPAPDLEPPSAAQSGSAKAKGPKAK